MAGGMTRGIAYFGMVVGSSDPPGFAGKARRMTPNFVNRNVPAPTALPFKNARLLIMACLRSAFGIPATHAGPLGCSRTRLVFCGADGGGATLHTSARRAVRCTMLRRVRHARLERTAWRGDARVEKRC